MKKNKLVVILIIVAALALGGAGIWYTFFRSEANVSEQSTPTESDIIDPATPEDTKTLKGGGSEEETSANNNSTNNSNKPENTSPGQSSSGDAAVTITDATYDKDTKIASVKALVSGTSSGTCTAKFSKSGQKTVTVSSSVSPVTSYYDCGRLEVARSKFSSIGTWKVKISLDTGGNVVESATETITIK